MWAAELEGARKQATDEGAAALAELQAKLVGAESHALRKAQEASQQAQLQLQRAEEQTVQERRKLEDSTGQAQVRVCHLSL